MSWPKGKSRKQMREYRWHKQRREYNRAIGLRYDGKPRQRAAWTRYHDLDCLPTPQRRRISKMRWLKRERYDKGLTQYGTPRIERTLPPIEQAWRVFTESGTLINSL